MDKFANIPNPLPEWFRYLANDSYISAIDLAILFGVKPKAIYARQSLDDFPKPKSLPAGRANHLIRIMWKVSDIREWIAKRRAEERFTA